MEEQGTVIEVNNGSIKVEVQSIACDKCDHYQVCNPTGKKKVIEMENPGKVSPGDRVKLSMESSVFSAVSFLVYGVPVIGLIAGYLAGEWLTGSELAGVLSGGGVLVITYVLLAYFDRKIFSKNIKLRSKIIEVLGK